MVYKRTRIFTEGEHDYMKVLWEKGKATAEEVQEALREKGRSVNYGTVRNVLVNLVEKGCVSREKQRKTYIYHANFGEVHAKKSMLQNLLERVFNGSEFQLIATLLSNKQINTQEIEKIRNFLKELEKQ